MVTKICSKCGEKLSLDSDNFQIRTKKPLVYRNDCKKCISQRGSKYRQDNHVKILKSKEAYRKANTYALRNKAKEYHSRDDVKKRVAEYKKEYQKSEKYKTRHAETCRKYTQRPDVKVKIAKIRKDKYHANIDAERKYARERACKDHVKAKAREYYKRTRNENKKLRSSISSAITKGLRRNGGAKEHKSCLRYLGYSIADLKKHLQGLWEPWMNWSNYGAYIADTWNDNDSETWKWNIDHIKRHREFKYKSMEEDKFKECWALLNLRPLSAKENNVRQ